MTSIITIILLVAGWDFAWFLVGVKPLSPWHLKKLLKENSNQLSLIDVRTPWEFNWFHISTAAGQKTASLNE